MIARFDRMTTTSTSHIALEPGSDSRLARVCRLVGPHAISLVTTISPAGAPNTAPFSFVMACGYDPPMICFVCGERKHFVKYGYDPAKTDESLDAIKDTLVNIRATGEFVISPADKGLRSAIVVADKPWPYGTSELERAGLSLAKATKVRVPLIREAKISLECRLVQMMPVGGNQLVVGEVVMIHAAPESVVDGTPDVAAIGPIFEGVHENQYFELGAIAPLNRHRPFDYDECGRG
jgi:flavin reductase (DIM6/NTAB) family NADH-FMN oxidoreductase RutF